MTRYVVLGAGAVGGTIGGLLARSGHDVVLVARGAHAAAMRTDGLRLGRPDGMLQLDVPVSEVDDLALRAGDVLVISTKVQDAAALLTQVATRRPDLPLFCAQNGVEGERLALRRFPRVYGVCVMLPGTHLEPGVVLASGSPYPGSLDVGCYPRGVDDTAEETAKALQDSGFLSIAREEIMPWKYAKLLRNTGNAADALGGDTPATDELHRRARAEAEQVLVAAGIGWTSDADWAAYRGDNVGFAPVAGQERSGSSSWQSVVRGLGSIESDYLNGEITMLGRLHGVATPVNTLLQQEANALVARGGRPGEVDIDALLAAL
jgi:2-dehydropantoate 2-reductase